MSAVINSSGSDWQPCLFLFLPPASRNLWDVCEFKLLKEMTSASLLLFNYPQLACLVFRRLGSFHIHEQHMAAGTTNAPWKRTRTRVLALKTWMCKSDELAMCVHNMAASLAGGAGGRLGRITRNCATLWCSHLSGFSLTVPSGTRRFVVSYQSNCSQMFTFWLWICVCCSWGTQSRCILHFCCPFNKQTVHFLFLYVQRTCLWIYSQSGTVLKNTAQHSLQYLFKYVCSCAVMINLCKLLLPIKVFYFEKKRCHDFILL